MPPTRQKKQKPRRILTPTKDLIDLPNSPTIIAQRPSDIIQLFYGPPGVGKTTFVNGLGRVLFISTDRGTRNIKSMRVEVYNWEQLDQVVNKLEQNFKNYDYVCIDHVDDVCTFVRNIAAKELNVEHVSDADYGKGWDLIKSYLKNLIRRILSVQLGLVLIAHEEVKTIKSRNLELDRTQPAFPQWAWRVFIPPCDVIGYCTMREKEDSKGTKTVKRYLTTYAREELYCKDRSLRKKIGELEPLDPVHYIETFSTLTN